MAICFGLAIVVISSTIVGVVIFTAKPNTNNTSKSSTKDEGSNVPQSKMFYNRSHDSEVVMIQSIFNGHCLEVEQETDSVAVILSKCNGQINQLWTVYENGYIRSAMDQDKCIQIRASYFSNDVPIEAQNCSESNESQLWNFAASGEIRSPGTSNFCIDENGLGNIVTIWFCQSRDDQRWKLLAPTQEPSMVPSFQPTVDDPSNSSPQHIMIQSVRQAEYCLSPPWRVSAVNIFLDRCNIGEEKLSWIYDKRDGQIRSFKDQSKCIEVIGSSLQFATVELHDCDANKISQQWDIDNGTIHPQRNRKFCLDENGLHENAYVMECDDGFLDQQFIVSSPTSSAPSIAPSVTAKPSSSTPPSSSPTVSPDGVLIASKENELCIDVPKSNVSNGVDLILSNCEGHSSQLWIVDPDGFIRSVQDKNKCVQVEGSSIYDGKSIEINDCDTKNEFQQWDFLSDGAIKSRAGVLSYCIDGNDEGNVVFVWYCDEKSDQLWTRVVSKKRPSRPKSSMPSSSPSSKNTSTPRPTKATSTFTASPTNAPASALTQLPTSKPTSTPSPTSTLSTAPSKANIVDPTLLPTKNTTSSPTKSPSQNQTPSPTKSPTTVRTSDPTSSPNRSPTASPISSPTSSPTKQPSPTGIDNFGSYVEIHLNMNGYCMYLQNSDTTNNNEVKLRLCNGERSQRWLLHSNGSIRSALNNEKCIQVGNTSLASGLYIKIQNCDASKSNQKWRFMSNGEIRSKASQIQYCLDGNELTNSIVIWPCDETSDQYWTVVDPTSRPSASTNKPSLSPKPTFSSRPSIQPSYRPSTPPSESHEEVSIQFDENGFCLDLPNNDATPGKDIKLSQCNGELSGQVWIIDGLGYIRSSIDESKCIGVEGDTPNSDGSYLEIQNCSTTSNSQKWTFLSTGEIQSRGGISKYCMDGNSKTSTIVMWSCDKTSDQFWSKIVPTFKPSSYPSKSMQPSLTPTKFRQPSSSPTSTYVPVMIKADFNNHCLATPKNYFQPPENGAKIILSPCSGENDVIWIIDDLGYIHLELDMTKCIQIRHTSATGSGFYDGVELELSTCTVGDVRQQWIYNPTTKYIRSGGGRFKYCMDGERPGETVIMWGCDESYDQYWTLL